MNSFFDADFLDSFSLWFDHELLDTGQAYTNHTDTALYEATQKDLIKSIYASTHKQWVYDSSVSGATVPTGVDITASPVSRGTDGLILDFSKGRAIFDDGTNTGLSDVTATYSAKDFNVITNTSPEEVLLFESNFSVRPDFSTATDGLNFKDVPAPVIFITMGRGGNTPLCFGNKVTTTNRVRALIFSDEYFKLINVQSLFKDKMGKYFPIIPAADSPLNPYGDLKSPPWSYDTVEAANNNPDNLIRVEDVISSPINSQAVAENHPGLSVGVLEFVLSKGRAV